jgi:hypothetical protein
MICEESPFFTISHQVASNADLKTQQTSVSEALLQVVIQRTLHLIETTGNAHGQNVLSLL